MIVVTLPDEERLDEAVALLEDYESLDRLDCEIEVEELLPEIRQQLRALGATFDDEEE